LKAIAPSVAACGTQIIESTNQATASNPAAFSLNPVNQFGCTITFVGAAQYDNGFAPAVALAGLRYRGASGV